MSCSSKSHPKPPRSYRLMQALLGPVMKPMRLSCRDFAELCSLKLDRPLTFSESLRYRFHALMCGVCRRLPRQFDAIRDVMNSCYVCSENETDPDIAEEEVGAANDSEEAPLGNDARKRILERIEGSGFPGKEAK